MPHPMRRTRDEFLAPAVWQKTFEGTAIQLPGVKSEFLEILLAGMRLQRIIAEYGDLTAELTLLESYARLDHTLFDEADAARQTYRISAAYLLWPYYAAIYYGYEGVPSASAERKAARKRLCHIQALIYSNVRMTLDVLRRWFGVSSDTELKEWIDDQATRLAWRDNRLLPPVQAPDLCAIDALVAHLLELVAARPLVRKAVEAIQSLSLVSPDEYIAHIERYQKEVCGLVSRAFGALRVAQMTVFYHPSLTRPTSDIPLQELVFTAAETGDPIPSDLIPFFENEDEAKSFRRLASEIYSATDAGLYPKFSAHREKTIERLVEQSSTTFISDGATTNFFLTTEPPVESDVWPLWYKMSLRDIGKVDVLNDWSHKDWWDHVDEETLRKNLFPGENGNLHTNHHMSAYWDTLAGEEEKFLDQIEIPKNRPRSTAARFGYLMELLLRREEPETRTSFFFALAQTYEQRAQLSHFVGGTLRGLEQPGIPFCEERFISIAARMRSLVMAVAHYTTAHVIKTGRWLEQRRRRDFEQRVGRIMALLQGGNNEGDSFGRNGYLLFSTPLPSGKELDHDAWGKTQEQLKRVFNNATHLKKPVKVELGINRSCSTTWKALFYLGGDEDEVSSTFESFKSGWQPEALGDKPDRSDRRIGCLDCFRHVLEHLLGEIGPSLKDKIEVEGLFYLPSRPGIRFLLALCRFIVNVQSNSVGGSTITKIVFANKRVTLQMDRPDLINNLYAIGYFRKSDKIGRRAAPFSKTRTAGVLELLKHNRVFPLSDMAQSPWHEFLCDPKFAAWPIKMSKTKGNLKMMLEWDE